MMYLRIFKKNIFMSCYNNFPIQIVAVKISALEHVFDKALFQYTISYLPGLNMLLPKAKQHTVCSMLSRWIEPKASCNIFVAQKENTKVSFP